MDEHLFPINGLSPEPNGEKISPHNETFDREKFMKADLKVENWKSSYQNQKFLISGYHYGNGI
ncbi:hypothetical protein D5F52_15110 [Brevibacillus laterosporus]|nr:hypothetical protein D5F52_15110 [Brevibacillus laterosporus]MBG9798359.1 hypothetical protein [Brevibacillus laterosporus]PPA82408.1 hypothetical protein C4A75_19080 [Brevibacillus laterosporus]